MIPPLARRFVAGETPAEALDHVRSINERDCKAIVNLLGEHYDDRPPARADAAEYRALAGDVASTDLEACLSVKPSQLGLGVDEAFFRETLAEVVATAADRGVFVWIDMEDHTTTDATLDAFEDLAREYAGRGAEAGVGAAAGGDAAVGVCVQANLRRTRADVERLAAVPGKVRFVKGAYDEPPEIAYTNPDRVTRELESLLAYAFEHFDGGVAVGSHDRAVIDRAIDLHAKTGTDVEFQLLMGVREDLQYDLASTYDVWQYVPYGGRWLSYFYRRVTERRENLRFALRALLDR